MFTAENIIDTIQTSKKQVVNTYITNKAMAEALNQFVDAQTEYTKNIVKAGTDAFTTLTQESIKAAQSSLKFDYAKFGEGIMKAYSQNVFGLQK
jgi:phage-related baseplate assembly protein